MKKIRHLISFSILLMGFLPVFMLAQCPTLPSDLTLTTQAEVDAFATTYPGCTDFLGFLTIGPSTDITNLDGLAPLTTILRGLTIDDNSGLTDVSGLNNLTSVGRNIQITNNPLLTSIDLSGIGGTLVTNFVVSLNETLETLQAPVGLTEIGGNLYIDQNPVLENITGLENVSSVGNILRIANTLEDVFPDFANLTSVGREINISSNINVTSLNFSNVSGSLSTNFTVERNDALETLDAPVNLTTLGSNLYIDFNPLLENISGLENVTMVGNILRIARTLEDVLPDFSNLTSVGRRVEFERNPNVKTLNLQNISGSMSEGLYIIVNDALESVAGPINLASVGKDIAFQFNPQLNSVTGLENLTTIGQYLDFRNNGLPSIPNFSNLTSVGRAIYFFSNPNLTSIDVRNVGGSIGVGVVNLSGFFIQNNNTLEALYAPEPLTSMNGSVSIESNPNLDFFSGFGSLNSIAGALRLSNILESPFPVMLNLSTIGGELAITENPNVQDLEWLANLTSIGPSLRIQNNAQLSDCSIDAVCAHLAGPETRSVTGNTGCCLDEPILTNACNGVSNGAEELCDGLDNDCNGIVDDGDVCEPEDLPAMSQWRLFLLGLLVLTIGMLFLYDPLSLKE